MNMKGVTTMTNERPEIMFVGAREVREIPKGWQHPRNAAGQYVPLLPEGYSFDEEHDPYPTMPPTFGRETEIAAYETTSEGTPISPAFPNTPDGRLALCRWCASNATTFGKSTAGGEAWAAILFGDAGVALDGTVRA
jgi:hypothetical protein